MRTRVGGIVINLCFFICASAEPDLLVINFYLFNSLSGVDSRMDLNETLVSRGSIYASQWDRGWTRPVRPKSVSIRGTQNESRIGYARRTSVGSPFRLGTFRLWMFRELQCVWRIVRTQRTLRKALQIWTKNLKRFNGLLMFHIALVRRVRALRFGLWTSDSMIAKTHSLAKSINTHRTFFEYVNVSTGYNHWIPTSV